MTPKKSGVGRSAVLARRRANHRDPHTYVELVSELDLNRGLDNELSSLTEKWETLVENTTDPLYPPARGGQITQHPLKAMVDCVEAGDYPPPEVLLAILERWSIYLAATGSLTLEEAFIGPARRGSGNFSKRHASMMSRAWLRLRMSILCRQGHPMKKAAELLSDEIGGVPEPESILRILRNSGSRRSEK